MVVCMNACAPFRCLVRQPRTSTSLIKRSRVCGSSICLMILARCRSYIPPPVSPPPPPAAASRSLPRQRPAGRAAGQARNAASHAAASAAAEGFGPGRGCPPWRHRLAVGAGDRRRRSAGRCGRRVAAAARRIAARRAATTGISTRPGRCQRARRRASPVPRISAPVAFPLRLTGHSAGAARRSESSFHRSASRVNSRRADHRRWWISAGRASRCRRSCSVLIRQREGS